MRNTRTEPTSTILFDAGNTLAFVDLHRVAAVLAGHGSAFRAAELAPAEAVARAAMYRCAEENPRLTDRERWRVYVAGMLAALALPGDGAAERIRASLEAAHRADNLWRRVEADTPATLDRLRARGFRLGVVSNADGRVRALLEDLGLASRFEVIVDSHVVGVEKPDPRIFAIALEALRESPHRAVYVGDFPQVDILGARRAGIRPILLDPLGISPHVDCPVIARLPELEALLEPPPPASSS
ncbi:MAG: HAD family hydrolase [bacterium]